MSEVIVPTTVPAEAAMPYNAEAEYIVLGGMLLDQREAIACSRQLDAGDFYFSHHQRIFTAMQESLQAHGHVDIAAIQQAMAQQGIPYVSGEASPMVAVNFADYIMELTEKWGWALVPKTQVRLLKDCSLARRVIRASDRLMREAYEHKQTGPELVEAGLGRFLELRRGIGGTRGAVPSASHMDDFTEWLYGLRDSEEAIRGFRWDIPTLDKALGGHAEDDLVLLKAGTGCGKTTLLRQGALVTARHYHALDEPNAVVVYLLEGGIRRWYQGATAYLGKVQKKYLKAGGKRAGAAESGDGIDRQIGAAVEELNALGKVNLLVSRDCRSAVDVVNDVREKLAGGVKIEAVCIDYIQLLFAPGNGLREKVVGAMQALLDLRSEINFPLIVNSQVTTQENGQARAREAEDIENGASTILWMDWTPGEKNPDKKRRAVDGVGRIVTTKVRDGASPADVALNLNKSLLDRARIGEAEVQRAESAGPSQDHGGAWR